MQARDIMTEPVQTVDPFATAREAALVMTRTGVGALPVVEDGYLVGIVTDRDLMARCVADGYAPELTPVRVLMTPHPVTAGPTDDLEEVALKLGDQAIRRLPVVLDGRPVGIISADDIARFCADDGLIGGMMRRIATYTAPPAARADQGYALVQHVEYVDG